MLAGLPAGYIVRTYSYMEYLQTEAGGILANLSAGLGKDGNQWLIALALNKSTIEILHDEQEPGLGGGVGYRFQWEGSVGAIKILLTPSHQHVIFSLSFAVNDMLARMGVPLGDRVWGGNTTYRSADGYTGKQADQVFSPATRQILGWPTLVVETGVPESYRKLQEDVKWWFQSSSGAVRVVLVVIMKARWMRVEKWQLAPPNAPRPVTKAYLYQMRKQRPHIPPQVTQPAGWQYPYCAQVVRVDKDGVHDAPLALPWEALYDRPRESIETDVAITAGDFSDIAGVMF
jgi:hypothetical protein